MINNRGDKPCKKNSINAESSYEPLSDEKKLEIEQAWSSQSDYPLYWYTKETGWGDTRHYGTHEDCVALFRPAQTMAEKTIKVDDYEFIHSSGFNISIGMGNFLRLRMRMKKAGWQSVKWNPLRNITVCGNKTTHKWEG